MLSVISDMKVEPAVLLFNDACHDLLFFIIWKTDNY